MILGIPASLTYFVGSLTTPANLSANGSPVTSLVELRRVLYRTGVDGELTCTVLRGGEELEISFRLVDGSEQD